MFDFEYAWLTLFNSYPPFVLDCIIPYCVFLLTFLIIHLFFFTLDFVVCPDFILFFKFKPRLTNVPKSFLWKTSKVTAFNLLIISPMCEIVFYFVRRWRSCPITPRVPDNLEMAAEVLTCVLLEEVMVYYIHRALHHPKLYERFHNQHHEYSNVCTSLLFYNGTVEHIVYNVLPIILCPVIIKAHSATVLLWYFTCAFFTTFHHSGYELPFLPTSEYKIIHWDNPTKNFGALGYLDSLFDTNLITFRRLKRIEKM